jgi:hypothetical protein
MYKTNTQGVGPMPKRRGAKFSCQLRSYLVRRILKANAATTDHTNAKTGYPSMVVNITD